MKQILQSARSGKLELVELPVPAVTPGQVLVRNHFSVMSPGTEKMSMDFARKSMLGKARSRPDLVKQVVRKLQQEGPMPTYRAVMTRLEAPQPLGYSCAGTVVAVGPGVIGFAPGDRVACAGAGYANHAELVSVPENLVVHVPEGVALEKAAFSTLGAIAMQGLRVVEPSLGEVAAVIGLGLIGQLCVQLLKANGCQVLGVDIAAGRLEEARRLGADWVAKPSDDHEAWKGSATGGHGVDFALVTAASESSAPIQLAADLCRMKGRVGAVGATAMDLDRRSFYDKELELRMSMSYGPGRYDRSYEEQGLDYPISYVRWTENRNLQAFLALVDSGSVDPERLDVETRDFAEAEESYEALAKGERRSLAVLFRYDADAPCERTLELAPGAATRRPKSGEVGVAFFGAGNYAKSVLLPLLRAQSRVRPVTLATATGASARRSAEQFGFESCSTDTDAVLEDSRVDLVFITTRHDSHAELARKALEAGKAVWLEKPIGIAPDEVRTVIETARELGGFLSLGYNRRFSEHAVAIRDAFAGRQGPLAIHYTVAAGKVPQGTWITDPAVGGGRIVGEACHFLDLCTYLVGAPPGEVTARALSRNPDVDDSTVLLVPYPDGSTATIHYLANASSELPKERFEASADGVTALCDNFRSTRILGGPASAKVSGVNQDKGQAAAIAAVVEAVRKGGPSPFSLDELLAVARASFALSGTWDVGGAEESPPAHSGEQA